MNVVALPFSALAAVEDLAARCFETRWERSSFSYFLVAAAARNRAVFSADGSLEGYLLTLFAGGNLDIVSIAVEPAARRKGVAKAMLETLRGEPDVRSSTLEVRADNEGARKFYERLGYVVVGTRKKYYEGRIDATVMRWDRPRPR